MDALPLDYVAELTDALDAEAAHRAAQARRCGSAGDDAPLSAIT